MKDQAHPVQPPRHYADLGHGMLGVYYRWLMRRRAETGDWMMLRA